MAEYKGIKGFKVQTVSTDPAASIIATGTWSSGGNLNTARGENFGNGVGTQTAAAVSGGSTPSAEVALHEQYNGTSWTETTDINTARGGTWADGTQGAFWMAGGAPPYKANTETWNGSAWTEVNDLNTARAYGGGTCGRSSTLGLVVAGYTGTANTGVVEQWDGTNWTEVGDLNTARRKAGGFGTSTAAFAVGAAPSASTLVESWNGTSWTETTDINTGRGAVGAAGTITDGLIYGAEQSPRTITEYWNGTSWTEVNDMGVNQGNSAGAGGTGTSAFIAGGTDGVAFVANTEEWNTTPAPSFQQENLGQVFYNSTANAFKVTKQSVPAGTWSSGTGRYISYGGAGSQTACVTAGGYNPAGSPVFNTVVSETYNGTSWTEGNDLNTGRLDCSTFGSSTAGVLVGGGTGSGGPNTVTNVEIYDGTSWSETTDIPTATQEMGSLGTGTAGLIFGGSVDNDPTTKNTTIEWDGTSWTSGGNYPIYIKYTTGFGSLTNGIGAGGSDQTGAISRGM
jgi:hypothetical protein